MLEVLIGSGVAVISAICGWWISHRWQLRSYRLAVDADRARWNQGVERWAAEVIDVVTRMHVHFEQLDQEAIESSTDLAVSLSVLVDQGRLYFPNVMRGSYGEEKQQARQGKVIGTPCLTRSLQQSKWLGALSPNSTWLAPGDNMAIIGTQRLCVYT